MRNKLMERLTLVCNSIGCPIEADDPHDTLVGVFHCPFGDKLCTDITAEDWAEKLNIQEEHE